MNRGDAKRIAETISNEQLKQMFDTAKENIKDWTKTSIVNVGCTKGVAWNILAKDFDINHKYHILAKTNMVREFGEFLPLGLFPKNEVKAQIKPTHQDPIF